MCKTVAVLRTEYPITVTASVERKSGHLTTEKEITDRKGLLHQPMLDKIRGKVIVDTKTVFIPEGASWMMSPLQCLRYDHHHLMNSDPVVPAVSSRLY